MVLTHYGQIQIFIEKRCRNGIRNTLKRFWGVPWGSAFEVLVGFGKGTIFCRSKGASKAVANHWKSLETTGNHWEPDHPGCIFLSKCLQMLLVLLYIDFPKRRPNNIVELHTHG